MRHLPLLTSIIVVGVIAGCSSAPHLVETPPHPHISERGQMVITDPVNRELLASLVIDYINLYRSKHNLSLLNFEDEASKAAFWMSDYQAETEQVSHVASVSGMTKLGDRYRKLGGGTYACGFENAGWYPIFNMPQARNYTYDEMARYIVDGWINSPEHHENLVVKAEGKGFIGLGVAEGVHGGLRGIYSTMDIFFFLPQWKDYSITDNTPAPTASISAEAAPAPKPSAKPTATRSAKSTKKRH